MSTLFALVFSGLMVAAMVSDATERRIPNRLTYTGLTLALLLRLPLGPLETLLGVSGLLIAFGGALPLFALGAIGGGDVKLLAVVGAFLGPVDLVWALLAAAAFGLLVALATTMARGVLIPSLLGARSLAVYALSGGRRGALPQAQGPSVITVPYGIAIAAGGLIALFKPYAGLLP